MNDPATRADVAAFSERAREGIDAIERVVLGQSDSVRMVLCCLLAGGHALLEGVPGTAKTLLARAAARTVGARFRRVQFTPDLMPSDIIGTHVWDPREQEFRVKEGPVFTDMLLADEINRTPPKTQAALLEAMEERAATLAGERRTISPIFTVLATQNPLEFEGTYPLPEAQLDRFMMKIRLPYPDQEAELEVLRRYSGAVDGHGTVDSAIEPLFSVDEIVELRSIVGDVVVSADLIRYVRSLLDGSRRSDSVHLGLGTRAGLHLIAASRAWALLAGRDFVTPDDIKDLASAVLAHRLVLEADAQMDGVGVGDVITDLLQRVEVPR
jgi:MoxR-like ATPase